MLQYIIHAYAIHYVTWQPPEARKFVEVLLYAMFADIRKSTVCLNATRSRPLVLLTGVVLR